MKTIYKKLLLLLLLLPFSVLAQSTLSGTVSEKSSGLPLPGVNVTVEGTQNGSATDFDGKFKLTNVKKGDRIVFSYIGFKEYSIVYDAQTEVTVSLEEDSSELDEVVVIGYGSVKKKDATGSVTSVTSKDFNRGAIISADQLLTGKAAGIRITNNGGQPDSAPNIRIRGGASLNANSSPLLVIDGIPVDNTTPAGVGNPLSLINPNDIESFTILKDASAAAIYGSRASNGVIIITTKKGSSGKPEFNYSANVSVGKVTKQINLMNGPEFTRFIQENFADRTYNGLPVTNLLGIDDPTTTDTDNPLTTDVIEGRILSNTDWQDEIYRTAISTDHNFSAKANLYGKIPFRASLGYTKNQGVVNTNDYKRYSYSLKMTPTVLDDHLKIDLNAKGIITDKNAIDEGGALGGAVNMDPTKPVFDPNPNNRFGGYYQDFTLNANGDPTNTLSGQYNPVALLQQRQRPEKAIRFLGNVEFDYKTHFLPELRAVVNLGLDASRAKIRETFFDNSLATYRVFNNGSDYRFNPGENYSEDQTMNNTTMDAYLVYAKNLDGFITKFDVQGGYAYQNFKNDGYKTIYQYIESTGVRDIAPNDNNPNNRYYNELNLQSFFGRANIDFANRYLLTFSLRADGSSLFREDKRWGYFPSAALAWKINEEDFIKNLSFVNDLKVRLGWGKTGQQDITAAVGSFYPSMPLFNEGNNNSQYLPGVNLYTALAFNDDLTWEKTTTYNLGIDFDFFKNNFLSGSFDIYSRETTDLLAVVPLPPGQGLKDTFVKNVGSTESKGFELNLNLKPVSTDDFTLDINTNVAYSHVEVTDLKGVTRLTIGPGLPRGTNETIYEHAVGFQPTSFLVFQQLYDENGGVIPGAFVDRNGDNQITNDDRYYREMTPNWTFGFGFNFTYKNWDLNTSFRGQYGGQIYNARKLTSGWVEKAIPTNSSSLSNVLDFYSGEADLAFQNYNGNAAYSDYFLEDATFLRCENIVLGYRFEKFVKNSSLRLYGAVNNPFIITKYTGQDPENFSGIDNNFYPRPTTYTFGLSLDF